MQEMFVPSLIEIALMFHFKDFFQYTNVKIVSPLVSHLNLYKLKSALCQKAFM
jgi:hypothetical protein